MKILCSRAQATALANYFQDTGREQDTERDSNFIQLTLGPDIADFWQRLRNVKFGEVYFVSTPNGEDNARVCDCARCQIELKLIEATECADINAMTRITEDLNKLARFTALLEAMVKLEPAGIEAVGEILQSVKETEGAKIMLASHQTFRRAFYDIRQPGIINGHLKGTSFDEEAAGEQPRLRIVADGKGELLFGTSNTMRTIAAWSEGFDGTVYPTANRVELTVPASNESSAAR